MVDLPVVTSFRSGKYTPMAASKRFKRREEVEERLEVAAATCPARPATGPHRSFKWQPARISLRTRGGQPKRRGALVDAGFLERQYA
jgi:hypothetical protein